jgi:hypothetical protein
MTPAKGVLCWLGIATILGKIRVQLSRMQSTASA